MNSVIQARGLGKCYRMRGHAPPTLFGALTGRMRRVRASRFWALRGVDFDVRAGQTVGVIGPNGSGKSSLLGLVAGTIAPTEGYVRAEGRLASLLELGAGFHPDLTGRENVFLNAAILGIPREDIRRRYDRIVEFAGLKDFMDQPVKNYSSGMYVRLGFAVAVELDPDILLIDEVLAVGDVAFQLKCLDRIRAFQRRGKTLLFVSHALQTVEEFCDEVFLMYQGRLAAKGPPDEMILRYLREYMGEGGPIFTQEFGTRDVEIRDVRICDADGHETGILETGRPMRVDVAWEARRPIDHAVFGFSVKTANGLYVFGSNTQIIGTPVPRLEGRGIMRLVLDPLTLLQGSYLLSLAIHSADHTVQFHRREDWYPFAVHNSTGALGLVHLNSRWETVSEREVGESTR